MVILVKPKDRSDFHDLSVLEITHRKGKSETPMRTVNRHDLSAKENLGVDLGLGFSRKFFVIEEPLNLIKTQKLMEKNGYAAKLYYRLQNYIERFKTSESLVFFYPKFTREALEFLDQKKEEQIVDYLAKITRELNLESLILPPFSNIKNTHKIIEKNDIQYIPVLDLSTPDIISFQKSFNYALESSSNTIPIIAFKFAPYIRAHLAYDIVMPKLDLIHEKEKATMMVNTQRQLPKLENVSGSHYGSFYFADLTVESYSQVVIPIMPSKVIKPLTVRIFDKNNLNLPNLKDIPISKRYDIESELNLFRSDKELQQLLERILTNSLTPLDISKKRPSYMSRIHENLRTVEEFSTFQERIKENSTKDYFKEKGDFSEIVFSEYP